MAVKTAPPGWTKNKQKEDDTVVPMRSPRMGGSYSRVLQMYESCHKLVLKGSSSVPYTAYQGSASEVSPANPLELFSERPAEWMSLT